MAEDSTVGIEVDGIPVCVDRAALDDIAVMELLGEMQAGNILALPRLMRMVFGDEQYASIKESLAEDGRTSAKAMAVFFREAFKGLGEAAKN